MSYMEEAEYLADRINLIAAGRIVAAGTPESLGGRDAAAAQIRFSLPAGRTARDLPPIVASQIAPLSGHQVEARRIEIRTSQPLPILAALTAWAVGQGLDLPDLEVVRPTLEDIYLQLTQGPQLTQGEKQ